MKKTSDDLFKLVKSLTKSEKGYFVKFAKRYSRPDNNSLKLYEAIEKQAEAGDEYDEEAIKSAYAKETFVKQLGVTKIYLYNLILKSLDQYYSEENERAKLNELISHIKILERKALYKQSHKLLKRAKDIAYKHEIIPKILELIIMEKNLIMNGPAREQSGKRNVSRKEELEFLLLLENYLEYNWLSDRMVILAEKRSEIEEPERLKEIEEIHSNPLLQSIEHARAHHSQTHFYNMNILYHLSKNNFTAAQKLLKEQVSHTESKPEKIKENPRNYIINLMNYLLFSDVVKNDEDIKQALAKIEEMRNKYKHKISRDLEITISIHAVNIEILIYNRAGDTVKSKTAAAKAEALLKEYNTDIPYEYKITLLYNLAKSYFLAQDYKNALKIMNELLSEFSGDVKPEIFSFAKILNLIIHLELQHNELLEYITNTTYRFLKERKKLYKVEELFLKLLKELLNATSKEEITEGYREFRFNLGKLKDDRAESRAFQYFEFEAWAESKITGRPMAEILSEYNKAV
jgi:hypothetical protein